MIVQKVSQDANQFPMVPYTMSKVRKIAVSSLNDYLTCKLCRGYYIDATTIIECLHSFCRSCIIKYLQTNKYCPICDVQVHKTKPLINIRPDKILQCCVYKLVPRLFQNEMLQRKSFYASHPEAKENLDLEELGEANYQHILAPDENICVALHYKDSPLMRRYLQCSAAISIFHLQKLIRSKYDLSYNHRIDIYHEDDILKSYLTLIDVAYTSLWKRRGPLELTYQIYEGTLNSTNPETKSASNDNQIISSNNNNNNNNASNDWKEVQIQISENGEMSVTGIQDCLDLLDKMDDKSTEKHIDKSNKKDEFTIEALKTLKNYTSKITKVELNQPVSQNSSSDVAMTIYESLSLPAVTLTASEIRELSKIEEAAKTQLSDAIILPPPAKKPKKDLPNLKLIGSCNNNNNNKSLKKNGAKIIPSPKETLLKNECVSLIASSAQSSIASTTLTTSKPANTVDITSVTVLPACTTQLSQIQYDTTKAINTTLVTASANTSTVASMSKCTIPPPSAQSIVAATMLDENVTLVSSINSKASIPNSSSTSNTISNVKTSIQTNISTPSTKLNAKFPLKNAAAQVVATVSTPSVKTTTASSTSSSKRKHPSSLGNTDQATAQKLPKPTILNHSLGMQKSLNLSKNHPLTTKQQKALESASGKATNNNNINNTLNTSGGSAVMLNQIPSKWNAGTSTKTSGTLINPPKVSTNQTNIGMCNTYLPTVATSMTFSQPTVSSHSATLSSQTISTPTTLDSRQISMDNSNLMIKSKASTPIGYKTLKDPPKTWNPTLQPMHLKPGGTAGVGPPGLSGGKAGDLKNVRPAKFFKMRNNMPRYLGCPNSGVKPMFQVHVSPDKEKTKTTEAPPTIAANNQTAPLIQQTSTKSPTSTIITSGTIVTNQPSESMTKQQPINSKSSSDQQRQQHIRKHSIVKIDPKTLKPISEKAPESSNLSTKATVAGLSSGSGSSCAGNNVGICLGGGDGDEQKGVGKSVREEHREQQQGRIGSPLSSSDQHSATTSRPNQSIATLTTSNSNLSLRINTTSVSITNPLKKSPHSPKKSTSPPTNQLLKSQQKPLSPTSPVHSNKPLPLNQSLNFTPSNPFIPNPLASPTLNPNQFNLLTAAAISAAATQGFHHGFDPRYHHHHHHHLPYHHQLYPPRLPPFGPAGNWWGSSQVAAGLGTAASQQQQVPFSSSVNRNTPPRGLVWNGPSTDNKISSPKETKTATVESKSTSLDVALLRSSSSGHKNNDSTSGNHTKSLKTKETNINDSTHDQKDDTSKDPSVAIAKAKTVLPKETLTLSESEDKIKIVSDNVQTVNKMEKKNVGELQSTPTEKLEKVVQKNASTSGTPKENVALTV